MFRERETYDIKLGGVSFSSTWYGWVIITIALATAYSILVLIGFLMGVNVLSDLTGLSWFYAYCLMVFMYSVFKQETVVKAD